MVLHMENLNDNLCICLMALGRKYLGQSWQQPYQWLTHLIVQVVLNEQKMQMM